MSSPRVTPGDRTSPDVMGHPAVSVANLGKMYPIYAKPSDRLQQGVRNWSRRALGRPPLRLFREFWALEEVSFEINRGEAFGVIGQNGSGKSTLLQIIAGTLSPTAGRVVVDGRVSALLELGSGFNPEFTGRENVFLYGSILGLSEQEMAARYSSIAAFAQIGDFINQPVKTYSSGMQVRLAFAVAACVEPAVLILDEALAVGDTLFQSRCFRRMEELRDAGTTILLVSHDVLAVQSFCHRALLLDRGRVIAIGDTKSVVNKYSELLAVREREYVEWLANQSDRDAAPIGAPSRATPIRSLDETTAGGEFRYGTRAALIEHVELRDTSGRARSVFETGETATVVIRANFSEGSKEPVFAFSVHTPTGVLVCGANTWYLGRDPGPQAAGVIEASFTQPLRLAPGNYVLSVGLVERREGGIVPLDRRYDLMSFKVTSSRRFVGLVDLGSDVRFERCRSKGQAT